jgi:L-asparagine transporter-like permease
VSDRFATPWTAIVIHAVFCAAFAVSGTFVTLAVLAVLACLCVYLVCCLATLELRRKNVRQEGAIPFRVPGGPVIPILAVIVVLWLMSSSTRQEFTAMGVMFVIATLLFFVMRAISTPTPTLSSATDP